VSPYRIGLVAVVRSSLPPEALLRGLTRLRVLHDLNQGQIVATGEPWDVLNTDLLRDIFGVHATVIREPTSGKPVIIPHRSAQRHGAERAG
jgi:ABC-type cobalamin/Fe3+-siderophores transport system ATPase subunit